MANIAFASAIPEYAAGQVEVNIRYDEALIAADRVVTFRGLVKELYIECGALILAEEGHSTWEEVTMPTFDKLGVPYVRVGPDELPVRFPQFDFRKVAFGLWEPEAGMVLAHRAVTETFKQFLREGGQFRRGRVTTDETETPLLDGKPLSADLVVMSCGSWLAYLFRQTLGPMR